MRSLVLGGAGMLGHKLWQELRGRDETFVTVRRRFAAYRALELFDERYTIECVDATEQRDLERAFDVARPGVVFNAVGIVKQLKEAHDAVASITVNALLPHRLTAMCRERGARLIHVSTDCVFSGRRGGYVEADEPDPVDLYGRSKLLGEVEGSGAITVRTSMIGREIGTQSGLVEWFLAQRGGAVRGFRRAVFSGLTTRELARILADMAARSEMTGLWNVSADPVTKFDLLSIIDQQYGTSITIEPDETFECDRSLDSSRFRAHTGFVPKQWPEMIAEMHEDATPYELYAAWRTP